MEKLRINEVIVVEGKYDAVALESLVEGLIVTTGGFSVFADAEKKELIKRLGKKRGLLILTDSDKAGFQIRNYIEKIAKGCIIKHAYIPAIEGKEKRKDEASKEGTLGVEGLSPQLILKALKSANVDIKEVNKEKMQITPTDLYEWGISGTPQSAQKRREFLRQLDLPPRLSKRALCMVLSALYDKNEVQVLVEKLAD